MNSVHKSYLTFNSLQCERRDVSLHLIVMALVYRYSVLFSSILDSGILACGPMASGNS